MTQGILGWDIGGVNTKVARVLDGHIVATRIRAYEIQRDPFALTPLLAALSREVGASSDDAHAVTMTAELSQMFRTKREGVAFVIDAVTAAFPSAAVHIYTVDGRFLAPDAAKREPLAVAASNWAATGNVVATAHPNAILIDVGTTTTDIIPIEDGLVVPRGMTDPERLASGELVYTGALRTPVEAIVQHVPLGADVAGVSAESFALIGDIHLWRGDLAASDYTVTPPDGRAASREFAGERIARVVCADREMLGDAVISGIADAVAERQVELMARAVRRVHDARPSLTTAVVTGLGAFIAERAARRAGLGVVRLADAIGNEASRCAPAAAVALLRARGQTAGWRQSARLPNARDSVVDRVVKVGGSLLASSELLDAALDTVIETASRERTIIVPGGGLFADAVRDADERLELGDDAPHWMAILAMDQLAHLLVSRRSQLALATSVFEVREILASGRVPVLAPFRLLRERDPLPHSWDVTSDSISTWIASELRAPRLILMKHPGANVDDAVDPYFSRALPPGLAYSVCRFERSEESSRHSERSEESSASRESARFPRAESSSLRSK